MNKSELIKIVAKDSKITIEEATKAIDSLLKNVTGVLEKDGKIIIRGFGTFSVKKRSARDGFNPATRKPIKISAKKIAKFRASGSVFSKTTIKKRTGDGGPRNK